MHIARRHWVALVTRSAIPFGVGLLTAAIIAGRGFNREPDFLGRQPPLIDGLSAILLIIGLMMLAVVVYIYYDWRNDFLIASNKRVIIEDRTLFLSYRYEIIPLERVQNVNIRAEGLQKLLGTGRIEVQASGPSAPVVFERVRQPAVVQQKIMSEVNREKRDQEQLRLQAVIQKRVNPQAPLPPSPQVPIERDLSGNTQGLAALLPFRPSLVNGTITWHKHWIVLLQNLLWPFAATLGWIGLLVALPRFALLSPTATTLVLFVGLIAIIAFYFYQIDDWRNDVYVLEPTKIIDVSRLPLGLFENRVEASLGAIQNVNSTAPNLVAQLLGYGDVLIETAGMAGNLTFDTVPRPDQVQRMIFEYVDRYKWTQRERDWGNALTIVEQYHQFRTPPPQP